jgi:hypothetical protein
MRISVKRMTQLQRIILDMAIDSFVPERGEITYIGPGREFFAKMQNLPFNALSDWVEVTRPGRVRRYDLRGPR